MSAHKKNRPPGTFEQSVGTEVFGGYPEGRGLVCPKCKSKKTEAIWRDAVWEETGMKCLKCGNEWVKA